MLARFLYKDKARKTKKYHSNKKKMKKLFFVIASVAATVLTACDGNEGKITANQLNGEWEPVWIYDVDSIIGDIPFLGFDTKVEGLYGSTGCNRLMGTYTLSDADLCDCNRIEFNQVGTTRMMCEDMATEKAMLTALDNASYCSFENSIITISDSDRVPLLKLTKRPEWKSIDGHWDIIEVNGTPAKRLKQDSTETCMVFDMTEKRVSVEGSCNIINSNIIYDKEQQDSLKFSPAMTTLMACPDMTLEQNLIAAINEVRSFKFIVPDSLVLSDKEGSAVLTLKR